MPQFYFYKRPELASAVESNKDLLPHLEYVRRSVRHLRSMETSHPDEADAFIVPINLIHFQFSRPQVDPWDFLKTLPHLDRGRHILWATGDYGQRTRGRYESFHEGRAYPKLYEWLDDRFRLVVFESTPDTHTNDIATLPYVLDPVLASPWQRIFHRQPPRRDLLISFCGALSYSPLLPDTHIRGRTFSRLAGVKRDYFVGTAAEAKSQYGRHGTYHAMFRRSVFTLCPAGFGRWTFRLVEALHYGSIPVVISDDYVLPYSAHVPWDDLIVRCAEKDVDGIEARLRNMSQEEILFKRLQIASFRHYYTEEGLHQLLLKSLSHQPPLPAHLATIAGTAISGR